MVRRTRFLRTRWVERDFKSAGSNGIPDGSEYWDAVESGFKTLVKRPPADQEEGYNQVNGGVYVNLKQKRTFRKASLACEMCI